MWGTILFHEALLPVLLGIHTAIGVAVDGKNMLHLTELYHSELNSKKVSRPFFTSYFTYPRSTNFRSRQVQIAKAHFFPTVVLFSL